MTKKQILESFKQAKNLMLANEGNVHFFLGALCSELSWNEKTHRYDEKLRDELMRLIMTIR